MNDQNRLSLPTAVRRVLWTMAGLAVIAAGLLLGRSSCRRSSYYEYYYAPVYR